MIADVCLPDEDSSHKLICRDGAGYLQSWALDENCEGDHMFEQDISVMGLEVVCDADPCHIAVIEVYDDGSDSSDSSDYYSGDMSSSFSTTDSNAGAFEMAFGSANPFSRFDAVRRLQDSSDSSSSDSIECDFGSTPELLTIIVDACLAVGETESWMLTCTGVHDATISYFTDDENHECSGTAAMSGSAIAIMGDGCSKIVGCDVEAGEWSHDAAITYTVFAPLLIATTAFLSA